MYVAGKETKKEAGPASIYSASTLLAPILSAYVHELTHMFGLCDVRRDAGGRRGFAEQRSDGRQDELGGRAGDRARREEAAQFVICT